MASSPRFLPENETGVLVEIIGRTIGAQALLVPQPNPHRFNEIVAGVLGRALEVSPVELCVASGSRVVRSPLSHLRRQDSVPGEVGPLLLASPIVLE